MASRLVTVADIQAVSDVEGVVQLLGKLKYDTSTIVDQTAAALGVAERAAGMIRQAKRLVADKVAPSSPPALEIYWFEVSSLTADLRRAIVSAFRNKVPNVFLLMTTRDFGQLDFVLIEKSVTAAATGAQVAVAHQLFSVDRRHPTRVHLRVINRLTRTALDPYAQYDRIRDAFRLAEWSEDEFNNRALFSDHFLQQRLRDQALFPIWHQDFRPAHRQLLDAFRSTGDTTSLDAHQYVAKFILPIMDALGFSCTPGKEGDGDADFLLRPSAADKDAPPCAALLAYPWDRPLDRKDDRERPHSDDVPGIRVVKVLQQQNVPWAIVTNGKDWRLYCAAAHSRASNYYEIDLPDTLEHEDLIAFRYFYLFFRAESFCSTGVSPVKSARGGESTAGTAVLQASFLDQVRSGSAQFAKELGDRLRQHIFDDVFPYLAQGFVDHRRQQWDEKTGPGDAFLAETYDATLTLLYRLLFLLYAESLDLLPVHEPAYADLSLSRLKNQIADAAGPDSDNAEDKLKAKYTKSDTALYGRLSRLFAVIDNGSADHNVPVYNGGLFNTSPDPMDTTREAAAARFLKKHKVPDFYLARALDLLARSEDAKTGELAFMDYKSLGVRQLGSVYEGLLIYHVVVPRDEWEKGFQRPGLKIALVPSNKERKSTGSFFTPQHIVKYIVTNTVGPLLDEKFAALEPKLRAAQREYHEQRKYEASRNLPPVLRKAEEIVFKKHADVVHELFDIKVLDMAMGSGHFAVETIDYITDRVLEFLAGFPWNPVQVFIDRRVRRPIVDSLEAQGIKINEQRLTDVNLIKRLVMKRCVYGVDLNPMAVELAKVSVWLDSFTIGAPLSFMDHHFRCGNSLIGSSIADLQKLAADKGGLWTIPMEPLERATRNMELIADLSDVTLTEVHRSAETYNKVLEGVRGYRVLLDCMTAEHFGVEKASGLVTEGHDLDFEQWDKTVASLPNKEKRWVAEATRISGERRFFHWDIDFPDVFFTTRRPPELRRFDAIVGNPPYDELSEDEAGVPLPEKRYLENRPGFEPAKGGRQNLFRFFIINALSVARPAGRHGFIVPLALIADQFSRALRIWMFEHAAFSLIEAFPQKDDPKRRVFEEAKLPTVLYVVAKGDETRSFTVNTNPAQFIEAHHKCYECSAESMKRLDPENMMVPLLGQADWQLLQRLSEHPRAIHLDEVAKPSSGEIVFNESFRPFLTAKPNGAIVLRGGHVQRYVMIREPKQGEPVYLKKEQFLASKREGTSAFDHQSDRVVYQECAAIDNYRRIIPAFLPKGSFCGHKVCYFKNLKCDPYALLAVFGTALHEWYINALSVTNSLSAYQIGRLPFPRFASAGTSKPRDTNRRIADCAAALYAIELAPPDVDSWPVDVEWHLSSLAAELSDLGTEQESVQTKFGTTTTKSVETDGIDDWTGATRLDNLNYLGWDGRFPAWKPDEATLADGRWYPNGVAPPLDGNGPGDIPWDLIARVYPSYPLPGVDEATWEAAAWEDFCDLLQKNKTKIGNARIRADLGGRETVTNPTGPTRRLQETFLEFHRQVRQNRARAAELDFLIDRIVFRLFDLTPDEQKLILSRVGPGRPLPPRRGRRGKAKAAKEEGPGLFTS